MMNFDGTEARGEIKKNFGALTLPQIWTLWKLSRHSSGRCRNSTAAINYFSRLFPEFHFKKQECFYNGKPSYETVIEEKNPGPKYCPECGEKLVGGQCTEECEKAKEILSGKEPCGKESQSEEAGPEEASEIQDLTEEVSPLGEERHDSC